MSGVADAALDVGEFLIEHADVVEKVVEKLAGGAPKEAIMSAIEGVQVKVSDDAIREELEAADARRRMG